ncbi:MAG TPA: Glu/Leu/Phe/Val dehydrogenase dimerization domain-containing protein [Actinomycetales bacterium]|nr:Glu/Leu/Phe/Val dehydrogenase dimerization domain-containing protein [Actinomycetales bacterium]
MTSTISRSSADLVFERDTGHEQVVFCQDRATGLRAIVAIYSTALGPALGGTRFYPYERETDALSDALALSKGMAYKSALAGLDLGGGKAVIIGDPGVDKSEALLRAYGRFVESLGGRYITACDVGTYVHDMDIIARETSHVTGRSESDGGAGDSSVLTSFSVYQGMRAAAQHVWGSAKLAGRRVGIAGVGKVGRHLVEHALREGAEVVVTDVNEHALDAVRQAHPDVDVVEDAGTLVRQDIDVYAPCALGGALTPGVVEVLRAKVVCGAANNQLADDGVAKLMVDRGITYCPDYLVNSGGLIQVSDELHGFSFDRAKLKVTKIFDRTLAVLENAEREGVTPAESADRLAERRMTEVGSLRRIWLP